MTVADMPRHRVLTIDNTADAIEVLKTMRDRHARELPVVEDGALVGVIIDDDIVAHLLTADDPIDAAW
jgi:CBS domain-containing protein